VSLTHSRGLFTLEWTHPANSVFISRLESLQ